MSSAATVRAFSAGDETEVVRMLSTSDPWIRLGYDAPHWVRTLAGLGGGRSGLVVEEQGAVVAFAILREKFLVGEYVEIFVVAESARRRGHGERLLSHIETLVFQRAKNLFICVSDFNEGARRFYARCGYTEVGSIPGLLVAGSAEILLRKTIGPVK
jgi:ribosomal protein S18 acetylase RimI-like enzyme